MTVHVTVTVTETVPSWTGLFCSQTTWRTGPGRKTVRQEMEEMEEMEGMQEMKEMKRTKEMRKWRGLRKC